MNWHHWRSTPRVNPVNGIVIDVSEIAAPASYRVSVVRAQNENGRRVILIREADTKNQLTRAEGYIYNEKGRRSHSVDEKGRITKYPYDNRSRLAAVLYPWTAEKAQADRKEAEEIGLYFTQEKGNGERFMYSSTEITMLRNILNIERECNTKQPLMIMLKNLI